MKMKIEIEMKIKWNPVDCGVHPLVENVTFPHHVAQFQTKDSSHHFSDYRTLSYRVDVGHFHFHFHSHSHFHRCPFS